MNIDHQSCESFAVILPESGLAYRHALLWMDGFEGNLMELKKLHETVSERASVNDKHSIVTGEHVHYYGFHTAGAR